MVTVKSFSFSSDFKLIDIVYSKKMNFDKSSKTDPSLNEDLIIEPTKNKSKHKGNQYIVGTNAPEYKNKDDLLLTQALSGLELSLVNRFYLIKTKEIRNLVNDSEIIFLKQNSNIPSYKLVLLSLILIGLHYNPIVDPKINFDDYLYKVNLLFHHINESSASNQLRYNMIYYVNVAISLLSYLPHPTN
ncbi:hypothetical protein K502DRAFT_369028 [Neoconidiobolus thromboides FSU 785]|nr:hypothetical protein K502DRAFT_369028 [Neoconidiobolus thromboides FSU 785]